MFDLLALMASATPKPAEPTWHDRMNCTLMCPTIQAQMDPSNLDRHSSWPLWLDVLQYFLIIVFSLSLIIKTGLRTLSFKHVFLWLQITHAGIRVVTISASFPWERLAFYIVMIIVPLYLQFLMFTLLATFLIRTWLVLTERAHLVSRLAIATIAVWAAVVVSAALVLVFCDCSAQMDKPLVPFALITYITLEVVLGTAGYLTIRTLRKFPIVDAFTQLKFRGFVRLHIMYTCLYFARTLWVVTFAVGKNVVQSYMYNNLAHRSRMAAFYSSDLIFKTVFETAPAFYACFVFYRCLPLRVEDRAEPKTPMRRAINEYSPWRKVPPSRARRPEASSESSPLLVP
eukprot:m.52034 g.52034  ORF g.52034 m.52034 type:complete len:343 (-) comp11278_c0_seq3:263-1291(-)